MTVMKCKRSYIFLVQRENPDVLWGTAVWHMEHVGKMNGKSRTSFLFTLPLCSIRHEPTSRPL
jgi:hypothetical protein